jgi:hypothetical protein
LARQRAGGHQASGVQRRGQHRRQRQLRVPHHGHRRLHYHANHPELARNIRPPRNRRREHSLQALRRHASSLHGIHRRGPDPSRRPHRRAGKLRVVLARVALWSRVWTVKTHTALVFNENSTWFDDAEF